MGNKMGGTHVNCIARRLTEQSKPCPHYKHIIKAHNLVYNLASLKFMLIIERRTRLLN